jgi:hypothetical protein
MNLTKKRSGKLRGCCSSRRHRHRRPICLARGGSGRRERSTRWNSLDLASAYLRPRHLSRPHRCQRLLRCPQLRLCLADARRRTGHPRHFQKPRRAKRLSARLVSDITCLVELSLTRSTAKGTSFGRKLKTSLLGGKNPFASANKNGGKEKQGTFVPAFRCV